MIQVAYTYKREWRVRKFTDWHRGLVKEVSELQFSFSLVLMFCWAYPVNHPKKANQDRHKSRKEWGTRASSATRQEPGPSRSKDCHLIFLDHKSSTLILSHTKSEIIVHVPSCYAILTMSEYRKALTGRSITQLELRGVTAINTKSSSPSWFCTSITCPRSDEPRH